MSNKRALTEGRLRNALQRLLEGRPIRAKQAGKLTLNKINTEAGLGNAHINKFPDFVDEIGPKIDEYNQNKTRALESGVILPSVTLTPLESIKADLKREQKLKVKYRTERDDEKKAKVELEALNNSLLFRVYELQEELRYFKVVPISIKG